MPASGPLTALPCTIGLTATTGSAATRSRTPGSAKIGSIDTYGFDGPMTLQLERAQSRVGRARFGCAKPHATHWAARALSDQPLLETQRAGVSVDHRLERLIAHR